MKANEKLFGDFVDTVADPKIVGLNRGRINSNQSSLNSPEFTFENNINRLNSQTKEG